MIDRLASPYAHRYEYVLRILNGEYYQEVQWLLGIAGDYKLVTWIGEPKQTNVSIFSEPAPPQEPLGTYYNAYISPAVDTAKTRFLTLHFPQHVGETLPKIRLLKGSGAGGVSVNSPDYSDRIFYTPKQGIWKIGNYRSDACISVVRIGIDRTSLRHTYIQNGSQLYKKHDGACIPLLQTGRRESTVDIEYVGARLQVSYIPNPSEGPTGDSIKIYAPNVNEVALNGKVVNFIPQGDYVTISPIELVQEWK